MVRILLILGTIAALPGFSLAQTADEKAMSMVFKDLLLAHLPKPALEQQKNWGNQKEVTTGMKFHRNGPLQWDAAPQKALRNDGLWQKWHGNAIDPTHKLSLTISEVKTPEQGRITFRIAIAGPIEFGFEHQLWKAGARLYSGETRGTGDIAVTMNCEATTRLEVQPGHKIPDLVVRLKTTSAALNYSNLKIDHTLGLGGDAARVIGDTAISFAKAVKPSMEKDLVAKANAALVKAGDTKDVRVKFDQLFAGKNPIERKK